MRIITFAQTVAPLLAGRKTCTRRVWAPRHAALFHAGDTVQAFDRSPRDGGRRVALIRLTADPELTAELPDSAWDAEGFAYMEEQGLTLWGQTPRELWDSWRAAPRAWQVVRFHVLRRQRLPLDE